MMKHAGLVVVGAFALVGMTGPGVAAPDPPLTCSVVDPRVTCIMTGLDNPRGLAFGPGGALFVAEAGYGGAPCVAGTAFNCYGLTGAISRLWHGRQRQIVTGLPSVSFRFGAGARGPHDIAMRFGTGSESSVLGAGGAHVTIGLEADPATRAALNRPDLGKLVHIPSRALLAPSTHLCDHDCWRPVVDIAAFEIGNGPDHIRPESDPYGLVVEPRWKGRGHDDEDAEDDEHGRGRHDDGDDDDAEEGDGRGDLVIDASGNSLLRVDVDGEISLVAAFPSRGTVPPRTMPPGLPLTDSVPTSVAVGPDGAYYVGELTGIPLSGPNRDRSNIYRIAAGQDPFHPTVFLDGHVTGFNAIIDIAFKCDDLYILQHWTTSQNAVDGKLIRVACGGRPLVCDGLHPTTVLGGLDGPTSFAFGPDGALYVTNHGASPAFANATSEHKPLGEVLRIDLGHEGQGCHDDHDHDGDNGHHDHDGHQDHDGR